VSSPTALPPRVRALAPALGRCEARLGALVSQPGAAVADPASDTLAAGGKRLRPLLVLCCASPQGREREEVLAAAAAVELVHMATLVHDDVLDGASTRRGRPTVASRLGPRIATCTGDALFALAFGELARAGSADAVRILADAALDLSLGEAEQGLRAFDLALTEDEYLGRVRLKTAALFAAACRLGAVLSDADGDADRLERFGELLGIAFQIFDDILDLTGDPVATGKPRGTDLRDGTVTLPMILALRQEPALAADLAAAPSDPAEVERLCLRLETHPGTFAARERALAHVAEARDLLGDGLNGADIGALLEIADGVVDRYA
jgi:geranylgeranyl pyrophosphate synthase